MLVYALVAALCPPLTWPAAIATLAPGAMLVAARMARPVSPLPGSAEPARAGMQWLGLLGVGALWELVAALWGNNSTHPTFSLLVSPLFEQHYGVRVAGYLCWLALGRWLVSR